MNSDPDIVKELRGVEKQGEMKDLKEYVEKISQIVDKNPIPTLVIDNKHIITHWNKALERTTGLSAEEMIGTKKQWKAFYSNERPILADLLVDNISENDIVAKHSNKYHKSAHVEGNYEGEDFFPHLGDDGKWFFITAASLRNAKGDVTGAIENLQDITNRKNAEEKLRNSEEKYRNLVEMAPDATITVDLEGIITSCNTAALKMIELPKDEYIGRYLSEVGPLQEGDMPKYLAVLDSLKKGESPSPLEFQYKRKDGISGWAEGHIGLLKNNEKIIGAQLIVSDTTAKRMALNELKDAHELLFTINRGLERKIKERTFEIEKLVKQKDDFINQLSHDLKTPLTPIMILMPIVNERLKDVKSRDLMKIINRNVYFIKDLVDKTVDLARLNSTKIEIVVEDTNLLSEVNNIIENSQVLLDENNIIIENLIGEKIFVKTDRLRLGELLNNLITNSIKYTPTSGGIITIEAKEDGDLVTVSVKDTGIGIKQERLSHVFDEFYKADISRHNLDSSGLGLSICKRIVEKHGGKIWVESLGRGMGTVFYFTLKSGKNNHITHG